MKIQYAVCAATILAAAVAFAQGNKEMKPAGTGTGTANKEMKAGGGMQQMDMSKMGPNTRKPTNESKTKKEIADFFKQEDELMKAGDFTGALARMDFPIYMATDDSKGMPLAKTYTKEEYTAEMKPFWENMPKDMKTTHNPTVTVLSDSLVNVVDTFKTTQGGKQVMAGKNMSLLVKKDGQWKWKVMAEAGWGDMAQGQGGSGGGTK
jgi:hypothetical protein